VTDRIEVVVVGPAAVAEAVRTHREFIMTETLARRLETEEGHGAAVLRQTVDVEGHNVTLSVRRHGADA
jgi:hypothetical protein